MGEASMLRYALRRLGVSALLVLGLMTFVFLLLHAVPGDPTARFLSADSDPEMAQHLRRLYGLDRPLYVQYGHWIRALVFERDLGVSFATRLPVTDMLRQTVPNTILLAALALALRFVAGIALGVVAAVRRGSWVDRSLMVSALVIYSMPGFWFAVVLLLVFSVHLGWLPIGFMHSLDADRLSWSGQLWDRIRHLVLPVVVLGIGGVASTARYMRASLIEALSQDYVRTARSKGLRERSVVLRHALRNALAPIVTLLGLSLPALVGGAVIIESIFSWPGMGRLTIDAMSARDYPVLLATTLLSALLVILGNWIADVLCSVLDPRLRTSGGT